MNLNNRILINELISGLALKGAAAAKAAKIKTRPLASFIVRVAIVAVFVALCSRREVCRRVDLKFERIKGRHIGTNSLKTMW